MRSSGMGRRQRTSSRGLRGSVLLYFVVVIGTMVGTASAGSIRMKECPPDAPEATYRWVNEGEYLYVEGAGSCVTLQDIFSAVQNPPLTYHTVDGDESDTETGIWLMTKNIFMESGTTLLLHDDLGCDELRIISSSTNARHLRAFGAYISVLRTKLTSWSVGNRAPDNGSYDGVNPRSFISAVSEMTHPSDTCDGAADDDAGEARIDIINSEVAYLGYQAAESYGISYKVRGYCTDESNPEVFDRVNVRGDIRFSDIHHNWFGHYSYGHQDGLWEYNTMHHCGQYGFDPHDDSDNIRIHNNIVYENGNHGIIASKRCNDVSIQNNVVYDNALHGIMLHRSCDQGIIRNNTVSGSGSACIAIFESFGIEISDNLCTDNEEGIRLSMGSSYNKIFDNQVIDTAGRSIWMYLGSDEVEASAATDGMCTGNLFQNNYLAGASIGVKMSETRDNMVIGNTFIDTDKYEWIDSDGLVWRDNSIDGDFNVKFSDTCVTSDSDFEQINGAGSNPSEC